MWASTVPEAIALRVAGACVNRRPRPESARLIQAHSARSCGGATRQIEKLVPQPQDAVACGLLIRNEAPIRSSTKSISEPAR